MAFTAKLASLFVEMSATGVEAVSKGLDAIKQKLTDVKAGADMVGSVASRAFTLATATLTGWITAGVYASAIGEMFALRIKQIALAIAGLFRPELTKLLDLLDRTVQWFYKLSDEQRKNIVHWVEATIAALGVARIMPVVIGAITSLVSAVGTLTAAFIGLDVASGGLLPAIGAIVTALTALGVGAGVASGGFEGLLGELQPVLGFIKEIWGEVKDVVAEIATAFRPVFAALRDAMKEMKAPIKDFAAALGQIVVALAKLGSSELTVFIRMLSALTRILIATVIPALEMMASVLEAMAGTVETLRKGLASLPGVGKLFGDTQEEEKKKTDKDKKKDNRSPFAPSFGGFETVEAAFKRIAQESIKMGVGGKSVPEKHLEVAEQQLAEQKKTTAAIGNVKPAIAS